jgi:hypothetical protein
MSENQLFLFRVMANNQGMYAVRVKAPDLQNAKDCLAKISVVQSFEHIEEAEVPDAMLEKLTEFVDCTRRQSSVK